MSGRLKTALHLLGAVLGLAGVVFVAFRLHTYAQSVELDRFSKLQWFFWFSLAIIYGAANWFLARAWWLQLKYVGVASEWCWARRTYGISQLGKYLPGNVFHLAGRQALGLAAGIPARPLAQSMAWELGLIAIAGASFAILAAPLLFPALDVHTGALVFLVGVGVLWWLARYALTPSIATALLWQFAFLVVSGMTFAGTLSLLISIESLVPILPAIVGAFVVAWLAGLLTPGAPAGIGVREAVLLYLLSHAVAPSDVVVAVVLGRGATVLGDLGFYLVCAAPRPATGKS
ncbi:hypothetical protein [Ottowia thiooxydans]|uniref:Uncharacterized membrane protein YbhN (UPF0104 family) n=1 Tax=Ottowia thiooxydans TaxID=219182 RepID=A0ABV2QBW6_9BURK